MRPMLERDFRAYTLHKPELRRKFVDSSNGKAFEADLLKVIREKGRRPLIAIDMSDIRHMSSAGNRVLLMALKEAAKTEGRIALANVNDHIWDKLEMMGVSSNFRRTTLIPIEE